MIRQGRLFNATCAWCYWIKFVGNIHVAVFVFGCAVIGRAVVAHIRAGTNVAAFTGIANGNVGQLLSGKCIISSGIAGIAAFPALGNAVGAAAGSGALCLICPAGAVCFVVAMIGAGIKVAGLILFGFFAAFGKCRLANEGKQCGGEKYLFHVISVLMVIRMRVIL